MKENINILENKFLQTASSEMIDQAFEQIFSKNILWTIPEDGKEKATTEIVVRNSRDEEEKIPVILFSSYGGVSETESTKSYFVSLGDKNGPTRNDINPKVKNLALRVFGKSK